VTLIHLVTAVENLKAVISFAVEISVLSDVSEKINKEIIRFGIPVVFKLDWSLFTCLTQLYGGIDMYNLLHKDQLHVSALFICHLQVDK